MQKFLVVGLSTAFLCLGACHSADPRKQLPLISRDTPIVVTGGSIGIESARGWSLVGDTYTTTVEKEVKWILETKRDDEKAEIGERGAPPTGTSFTVHLLRHGGGGGTIVATGASTNTISVTASAGSRWEPRSDPTRIEFINDNGVRLDQIDVELPSEARTINTHCSSGLFKKGQCKIIFYTINPPQLDSSYRYAGAARLRHFFGR